MSICQSPRLEAWIGFSRSEKADTSGRAVRRGRCYSVQSCSVPGKKYTVLDSGGPWVCACLRCCYGRLECRHILAARAAFGSRAPESEPTVAPEIEPDTCPECGSADSKKGGARLNKNYEHRKYRYRGCGRRFSANAGFGDTVLPPAFVTRVTEMASSGMPCAKIAKCPARGRGRVRKDRVQHSPPLLQNPDRMLRPAVPELQRTDEKRVGGPDSGGCFAGEFSGAVYAGERILAHMESCRRTALRLCFFFTEANTTMYRTFLQRMYSER